MNWFILAFTSALLSAAAALSQKKVLFKMEVLDFSYSVSLLSLIFSLPFFLYVDFYALETKSLIILYLKSILGTIAFLSVMHVIKNFEISKALPLMVLTPGLVAVVAYFFLGDYLSSKEMFGIILLMIGTYILEISDYKNILNLFSSVMRTKHYYYIIAALTLFTASAVLDRMLLTDYKFPPESFMGFQQLFFAFNFFIFYLIKKKKPMAGIIYKNKNILSWIILIAILTIGYRYTQIEATKIAPVAMVLSVKRISVFFSSVAGGKIFNERNLLIRAAAAAVMICGTLLLLNY